jgi:RNA polymerase sigma-70 factor (ECF subfamily)
MESREVDYEQLLREVDGAARRLARRLRMPTEIADLRQDLLVDLLARIKDFDPTRGSLGAFAATVLRHRASRIADQVRRHRDVFGVSPVSLDEPLGEAEGQVRGDLISEEEGLSAALGSWRDPIAEAECRLDMAHGLAALDDRDRELARALSDNDIGALAQAGFGSRRDLYRRARRLKLEFLAAGISND